MRITEVIESSLRAAKTPPPVLAKALSHVEEMVKVYGVDKVSELSKMADWELWLFLVKSIVSPLSKIMRREGYCKATYFVLGGLISLDERVASIIRRWVLERCKAGIDPCCSSPKCCGIV